MMNRIIDKGFTLVEMVLSITIVVVIATILIGTMNPILQLNRGFDARRKKDVGRIKVAFEDYYNDKGCFPILTNFSFINTKDSCNSTSFRPWLDSWPCDPAGSYYTVQTEPSSCPQWYKVTARLDNGKDTDIPAAVVQNSMEANFPAVNISGSHVNYGVSSTNILWYDAKTSTPNCERNCYTRPNGSPDGCAAASVGGGEAHTACAGSNCFADATCSPQCQTFYCDSFDR